MEKRKIYITEPDMKRLRDFLMSAGMAATADRDKAHLSELEEELNRGTIVQPENVPNVVITMNSKMRLRDMDTRKEAIYTLVYPAHADAAQNKICPRSYRDRPDRIPRWRHHNLGGSRGTEKTESDRGDLSAGSRGKL